MGVEKGWKVVKVIKGKDGREQYWSIYRRISILCEIGCDNYTKPDITCTHYPLNKWVKSKEGNGPFAVFSDFDKAENYCIGEGLHVGFEIVPCEYAPSAKITLWTTINGVIFVWNRPLPRGTVLADRVKLLGEDK